MVFKTVRTRLLVVVLLLVAGALSPSRRALAQASPSDEGAAGPRVTKAPRLVHFVEAAYPEAKKAAGIAAHVLLALELGADGKVETASVQESGGADFDAAALAAARQFVFEPAEVDGVPAPVKILYRYDFVVREEVVSLGPQVNLEGVVLERYSKRHLQGVRVGLAGLPAFTTLTDEHGHFEFVDVPPGAHDVQLSGPTLITVTTTEEIVAGVKKTVTYYAEEKVEGVDEEVVVRAPRLRKESVVTSIRTEEARKVPGTQGDTLKVVQNLPGVARASFGSGALVVWGAAPQDTRVFVDGVEIPALYHLGGLRSTVNSDLVKSIDLSPGSYGSDYGGGLGGLVRVTTRELPTEGVHGYAAADVLDASAMVTGAIGSRLRVALAGRYSYLDRLLPLVTKKDFGDFVPIPRYDDYQARFDLALRKDEMLSGVFLASDDALRRAIPSSDPAAVRSQEQHDSFKLGYLRYTRLLADGSSLVVTPSFGYSRSSTDSRFGARPTQQSVASWRYGLRASYRRKLAKPLTLALGLDLSGQQASLRRVGSVTQPPREGDITVFGQPPGGDVNADAWKTNQTTLAPFANLELKLGMVSLAAGLRLAAVALSDSRLTPPSGSAPPVGYSHIEWAAEPRVQLTVRPIGRLTLSLAGGLYHQAPDPGDLSAVFGNPTLGLGRAVHGSLGANLRLTGTLSVEAVAFAKYLDHLAVRSADPAPALARALVAEGIGRSYGGQVLLRQEVWKGLFGWASYSYVRSELRDHPGEGNGSGWRLSDYDQTHVLSLVGSYTVGYGLTFGARFRYATGYPRTPVVGAWYDARDDEFQPLFGAHNSARIPAFYQLDLRVEKQFNWKEWGLNLFLDVQNVTNRRNPEELVYGYDYSQKRYITGLPTLAVFGVRVERF